MIRRIGFAALLLTVLLAAAGGCLKGRLLIFTTEPFRQVSLTQMRQNFGTDNIVFDIEYPQIDGFDVAEFEDRLNDRILAQAEKATADTFGQALGSESFVFVLRVSNEVKNNKGILSLRVTDDLDNGGVGFPHTVYYNADIKRSRMLNLDDLFVSKEYRSPIDKLIRSAVRNDEHYFADNFIGVDESTAFFITDGQLHIAFAKYEMASGMTGEPDFAIPTPLIRKWLKPQYAPLFW